MPGVADEAITTLGGALTRTMPLKKTMTRMIPVSVVSPRKNESPAANSNIQQVLGFSGGLPSPH